MPEKRIDAALLDEFKTQYGRSIGEETRPVLLVFLRHFG
jgi:hypothetical protein